MEIKTKLSMGDKVVCLIDGKLVSLAVSMIQYTIKPIFNGKGMVTYTAQREDINPTDNYKFEDMNVEFDEGLIGKFFFLSKEDFLNYVSGLEVQNQYAKV